MEHLRKEDYRCLEACKNCPLLDNGKKINLKKGRVKGIKKSLLNGKGFRCHETIYHPTTHKKMSIDKTRLCYGAFLFLKEAQLPNAPIKLALALGIEDEFYRKVN